jgi:3-dehydroquinate synthase
MITASYIMNGSKVKYYFEQSIKGIDSFSAKEKTVIITDENVFAAYATFFEGRKVIVLDAGEDTKSFVTIEYVMHKLTAFGVNKDFLLVGMGGGVITDVTGFVASIYMRGITFAFMPTSLLAMVDAAIGGKNGINFLNYKNIVGTITQPKWIIFDRTMLYTLPQLEWVNAFAEIVKYGVTLDERLFRFLQLHTLQEFQDKHYLTSKLLYICTHIKSLLVEKDVLDNGERRLLNFGHTAGHAIEKLENIPHGFAIAKGMVAALKISEEINNFSSEEKEEVIELLLKFGLPTTIESNKAEILQLMTMDKKREEETINYILANKIGEAKVQPISLVQLKDLFEQVV